ncbi:hypothetical protein AZE42_14202 [Rhizopogon vesiculosus]|uniref:Uncharacterized protein n=1 Tax=Rhizopogon vesiculosus TaxID=180088 RepID=A0A1J8QI38_9AGAM|nr:hypothetical protein AZE42_14202 [Rhizopogon vesiculosus]
MPFNRTYESTPRSWLHICRRRQLSTKTS